ncbi:MAG: hypothetical protein ABGY75_09025, partial [Gemmataceae bacterium]
MLGVRSHSLFLLALVCGVGAQPTAYSQTISPTLGKSASQSEGKVYQTPAAALTGFPANTTGTVKFKVVSLNNASEDRGTYELEQIHTVTTDANGAVAVPGNLVSNSYFYFLTDEGLPGSTGWSDGMAAYSARTFKVYVKAEFGAVK